MFEGDSADMCGGKFPLASKGGRGEGLACGDPERGPPSVLAEIWKSCHLAFFRPNQITRLPFTAQEQYILFYGGH